MVENKIVLPLDIFMVPIKGKLEYLTLNPWITVNRGSRGSSIGNKHKKNIQARIRHYVEQAMVDGVKMHPPVVFKYAWYFRDNRIDVDNWSFTQKFILDAFQESTVKGDAFLARDSPKYVRGNHHDFIAVDADNPRVEITWSEL